MNVIFKGLCLMSCIALAVTMPFVIRAQARPRLVVGITVDQMRWDYLYRYEHRWSRSGGFLRFLNQGFSCQNTNLSYVPTYTACGHTSIFTGSVPAIHGITGNNWWDSRNQTYRYCVGDDAFTTIGSGTDAGQMSPNQLPVTTICDELKLATNLRGKTIGIAIKDRGGILAAGRSADAAYWYDGDEGAWITSSYYMRQLPKWANKFDTRAKVDSLYRLNWDLLYARDSYHQSVQERKPYMRSWQFPRALKQFAGANYRNIAATPYGNTLTAEFAKAAILGEQLGADTITDFLALSYSSTDYIGHSYGPNAIEVEDAYLRLDLELGNFLDFLDTNVGEGNYLVFLSSDHGAAHVPEFLAENRIPGGTVDDDLLRRQLNTELNAVFGEDDLVKYLLNAQVIFQKRLFEKSKKLNSDQVVGHAIKWLEKQPAVTRAFALDRVEETDLPDLQKAQIVNGYYPGRSGDIQLIYRPGYIEGAYNGGTTHGTGYAYDTHIPLLWYGWHIPKGAATTRSIDVTDIAPTVAALLQIQAPSGSVGQVIYELFEPVTPEKK
jgi:hypothetical protein